MSGSTIVLLYAQGERGLLFYPVHPPHHLGGVLLSCYHMPRGAEDYYSPQSDPPPLSPHVGSYYPVVICPGEQRTISYPRPPPTPMRGSILLLSYCKGSRGLLITPVHTPMRDSTILLSYTTGRRELLFTLVPPPHAYEGFYSPIIICQREQRTINHPSPPPPPYEWFYYRVIICPRRERTIILPCSPPTPPRRCSTILLSYAESSRGLLITPVHTPMRDSTILLSYTTGSRELLFTQVPPPRV